MHSFLLFLSKGKIRGRLKDQAGRTSVCACSFSPQNVFFFPLFCYCSFVLKKVILSSFNWKTTKTEKQRQVGDFPDSGSPHGGWGPREGIGCVKALSSQVRQARLRGGALGITEDAPLPLSVRNSKGFKSSEPGTGYEDQIFIYFITISQEIFPRRTRTHGSKKDLAFMHELTITVPSNS